jgi:hypothetical protein
MGLSFIYVRFFPRVTVAPAQSSGKVRTRRKRFQKLTLKRLQSNFCMLPGLPDIQWLLSEEFRHSSVRHLPPTLKIRHSLNHLGASDFGRPVA